MRYFINKIYRFAHEVKKGRILDLLKFERRMEVCNVDDGKIEYKSNNFIVANKKFDTLINSLDSDIIALHNQIAYLYPNLVENGIPFGFRFCNRIDYSTSGLVLIALNQKSAAKAVANFQNRRCEKLYLAIVRGHVEERIMKIESYIGECTKDEERHLMCSNVGTCCMYPKYALTHLCVLSHGLWDSEPASKLAIKITTGRRHQIRVHCSDIGHIILGDYTYSNRADEKPYRMMLHSFYIKMKVGEEVIQVETTDPFTVGADPRNSAWSEERQVTSLADAKEILLNTSSNMHSRSEAERPRGTKYRATNTSTTNGRVPEHESARARQGTSSSAGCYTRAPSKTRTALLNQADSDPCADAASGVETQREHLSGTSKGTSQVTNFNVVSAPQLSKDRTCSSSGGEQAATTVSTPDGRTFLLPGSHSAVGEVSRAGASGSSNQSQQCS